MTHKFDLSHLSQKENEAVMGPIQDSEALLLYALVKVTMARKIVEVGGLRGYSAKNFSKALGEEGVVFTIDIKAIEKVAHNHITIKSPADKVDLSLIGPEPVDIVFFDCHSSIQQLSLLKKMEDVRLVDDNTILALHDTNPHPKKYVDWSFTNSKGEWIHQKEERAMVNILNEKGWQALCLHTQPDRHSKKMPYRHGITIMKKFSRLCNEPTNK